jgi:hypothetical protein
MTTPKVISEIIEIKNSLLTKLEHKEITMAEFNKDCAYWLIKCPKLNPLSLPTRPQEMLEYDTWTPTEKKNTSEKFWREPRVFAYLEQKQSIINKNKGMLYKLKEFKEYLPIEDTSTRAKYDEVINEYDYMPDDVKQSLSTFGGKVTNRGYKDNESF